MSAASTAATTPASPSKQATKQTTLNLKPVAASQNLFMNPVLTANPAIINPAAMNPLNPGAMNQPGAAQQMFMMNPLQMMMMANPMMMAANQAQMGQAMMNPFMMQALQQQAVVQQYMQQQFMNQQAQQQQQQQGNQLISKNTEEKKVQSPKEYSGKTPSVKKLDIPGRRMAYSYFFAEKMKELKKERGEVKIVGSEMCKAISKLWNELTLEQKQPYVNLSEQDKVRYESDKQQALAQGKYKGSTLPPAEQQQEKQKKAHRVAKEKKEPVKPPKVNCFLMFSNKFKQDSKAANTTMARAERIAKITEQWEALSQQEKDNYKKMADEKNVELSKQFYQNKSTIQLPVQ